MLVQDAATIQRLQEENEALRCKVADQEHSMHEQGEAVKGQEQQVMNLEQQVVSLLSKVKDEQQGKAAAVTVSDSTQ